MTWTKDRIRELNTLDELTAELSMIDNGSGFVDRMKKCIALSKKLRKSNLNKPRQSFISFLRYEAFD